jgi:hypothetical protein
MTATPEVIRSSRPADKARTYRVLLAKEMTGQFRNQSITDIPITSSGSRRSTLEGMVCTPTISTPRAPGTSAHNCVSVEARGTA